MNDQPATDLTKYNVALDNAINLQRLARIDAERVAARTQHFGALPERVPVQGDLFDGWPDGV